MIDPTVMTSPRRDRVIRAVVLAALTYNAYYLWWRATETLNPDALWIGIPLLLAELYGFVMLGLFLFTCWQPIWRRPRPAPPGLSVDVFVTTYNESVEILRKTLVAARNITYPHRTWVLDDGCRDEVRELATALGVGYIPREECEHAKAGNLNSALALTDGDFFLQLDADHVPLPHIIDRLIGYFDDPRVAFVQSPQDFYNVSQSLTHVLDDKGRRMWEEQRIFFDVIQPGKDRWNASFFCGSCGMLRRAALDSIGGFSTYTITEDMETSLLLHARGWKSVYVSENLAYGLAPGSLTAYQTQRLRWGQGSMQVLRRFNPLRLPGLTLPQRICYFASHLDYVHGLQKAIFLIAPLVFFLFGVLPVLTVDSDFVLRFFPYVFGQILAFELMARGRGYVWLAERYSMLRFPIYVRALFTLATNRRLDFKVTPKGDDRAPLSSYAWQLGVAVTAPLAIAWATLANARGWVDYGFGGWNALAFWVNAFWLSWNMVFAWQVVRLGRRREQEERYRFMDHMPVRFHVTTREGIEAASAMGITTELGAHAVRFLSATRVELGERVRIRLPLTTGDRDLDVQVTSCTEVKQAGIQLTEHLCHVGGLDLETQTAIELHCVHHAVPGLNSRYRKRPDLFEDSRRFIRERRRQRREALRLPAQVRTLGPEALGEWLPAVLEEMDPRGAQLLLDAPLEPGSAVYFQVPGIPIQARGRVVRSDAVETPLARRWVVGVRHAEGVVEERPAEVVATAETVTEVVDVVDVVEGVVMLPGMAAGIDPALITAGQAVVVSSLDVDLLDAVNEGATATSADGATQPPLTDGSLLTPADAMMVQAAVESARAAAEAQDENPVETDALRSPLGSVLDGDAHPEADAALLEPVGEEAVKASEAAD